MTESNENITLEQLIEIHPISVRAFGICMRSGLITLNRLLAYYNKHQTFKNIQGCGDRVEYELTELLQKYLPEPKKVEQKITTELHQLLQSYKDLTPFKKSTLNHHIEYLLSNLSVRALNSLSQQFGNSLSKELLENAINTDFDFQRIRNVGEKTVQELNTLRNRIKDFITVLKSLPDAELSKEYTRLILKNTFPKLSAHFEQTIQGIFDENGKIRLFTLINRLVIERVIFNLNEQKIFEASYYVNRSENKSLEQLGAELQITKERVRQLKNNLEEEIVDYFSFIKNLNTNDICNYELTDSSNIIVIDDERTNSINLNEGVEFNRVFYSIILSLLLKNTHSVLGDDEVISGNRKTKRVKRFRKCYLIEQSIFNVFSFENLLEDVYLKLSEKIPETYSIYFEGYLIDFFETQSLDHISKVKSICEQLLLHEFDVVVDSEGFLYFERNTKKRAYEFALEVLDESNRLMTVTEIFDAIKSKYPELEFNEASVRVGLQREKELFIYIGRSSTYGLKKWELEQQNLKGGTIRDIVEEYLSNEDEPKHITEIMGFVLKYRETNEKNVLSNIKLEENERFVFYGGGFIGIKGKNYNADLLNFKKARGPRFTKAFISKFNNWEFEDVISFYASTYGYTPIQLKYIFENKCNEGIIQIIDNKIVLK